MKGNKIFLGDDEIEPLTHTHETLIDRIPAKSLNNSMHRSGIRAPCGSSAWSPDRNQRRERAPTQTSCT
jgi:hypothetical protein